MVSCSGIQVPCFRHFTWLICRPRDLCTEAQSEQMRIPLLTEAQLGSAAPQSAQTDRGWRDLDLLLLNIFRSGEKGEWRGGGSERHQGRNSLLLDLSRGNNVSSDVFLSVFSFPLRVFSPSFDWGWSVCGRSFELLPRSIHVLWNKKRQMRTFSRFAD